MHTFIVRIDTFSKVIKVKYARYSEENEFYLGQDYGWIYKMLFFERRI
ncbi:MAG: hypothetical protein LBL77_02490 [Endomicrobium sp.]|jgi:hypothetical protein|nr:hypothetical protein [Endomicrobium sp.]